jgi:hypothetical protein
MGNKNSIKMTELQICNLAKEKGYCYDHVTGNIKGPYGTVIKTKLTTGYINCVIYKDNKSYQIYGHRLSWFLHYGELPRKHIDHIDGNRSNNRIINLRDVNHQHNMFNMTKAKGYYYSSKKERYLAEIMLNYKKIFLGTFKKEQDARNAYLEAKKKYHVIESATP